MKRILHGLLLAIALSAPIVAQPVLQENPLAPLDTSSPEATLNAFMSQARTIELAYVDYQTDKTFAGEERVNDAIRRITEVFDLSQVPGSNRREVGAASFVQLFDILLRLPAPPETAMPVPPEPDPEIAREKMRVPGTGIDLVRIAEGPRTGEFLFSARTVAQLPEFHRLIEGHALLQPSAVPNWNVALVRFTGPLFSQQFLESLPEPLHILIFGTPAWKVVVTLSLLLAIGGFSLFWHRVVRQRLAGQSALSRNAWALTEPLAFAGLLALSSGFARVQVNTSGAYGLAIQSTTLFAFYVAAAWGVWILCQVIAEWIISSPTIPDQSFDAHLLRLIAGTISLAGAAFFLLFGANAIGLPALGVVASLGVGGVAVALAAQSTFENLFGGLNLFADRPFRVGDTIEHSDGIGTVEAIGPRSTRIRDLDGTLITIPNGAISKMHVTNFSLRKKFLFNHKVGLLLNTTPEQLERFKADVTGRLGEHPLVEDSDDLPRATIVALSDFAIEIDVFAYVLAGSFTEFLETQDQLLVTILTLVEQNGIGLAYPSQTIFLAKGA